jgi:hypothetical protein
VHQPFSCHWAGQVSRMVYTLLPQGNRGRGGRRHHGWLFTCAFAVEARKRRCTSDLWWGGASPPHPLSRLVYRSGILGEREMEDFSLDLIKEKYLKGKFEVRVRDIFTYSWVEDDIGYFHFKGSPGDLRLERRGIHDLLDDHADEPISGGH